MKLHLTEFNNSLTNRCGQHIHPSADPLGIFPVAQAKKGQKVGDHSEWNSYPNIRYSVQNKWKPDMVLLSLLFICKICIQSLWIICFNLQREKWTILWNQKWRSKYPRKGAAIWSHMRDHRKLMSSLEYVMEHWPHALKSSTGMTR